MNIKQFEDWAFSRGSVVVVFGGSLGDEGKGKVTTLFNNVDYVAVATGGANAGHTVIYNGQKIIMHELPGGAVIGKQIYIGQGRVTNISGLNEEIETLENAGLGMIGKVMIAGNANIILNSLHKKLDGVIDEIKSKSVGTTKKGIGIAYATKALRTGITFNIFLNDSKSLEDFVRVNSKLFVGLDKDEIMQEVQQEKELLNSLIKRGVVEIDYTNMFISNAFAQNKRILVEASQSCLLAIDGGMYPFCTSSDTSLNGVYTSLNLPKIDTGIVVMKAIKSKVGGGYFPTKFDEEIAGSYRELSNEFGATTGRPRDVGYFDAVEARKVLMSNDVDVLCITKADLLNAIPEVKIGIKYTNFSGGEYLNSIPATSDEYNGLEVLYSKSYNLKEDIYGITDKKDLPESYIEYFTDLKEILNFKGKLLLGTGPKDDQILLFD